VASITFPSLPEATASGLIIANVLFPKRLTPLIIRHDVPDVLQFNCYMPADPFPQAVLQEHPESLLTLRVSF
jgi:hypothetical protein